MRVVGVLGWSTLQGTGSSGPVGLGPAGSTSGTLVGRRPVQVQWMGVGELQSFSPGGFRFPRELGSEVMREGRWREGVRLSSFIIMGLEETVPVLLCPPQCC